MIFLNLIFFPGVIGLITDRLSLIDSITMLDYLLNMVIEPILLGNKNSYCKREMTGINRQKNPEESKESSLWALLLSIKKVYRPNQYYILLLRIGGLRLERTG